MIIQTAIFIEHKLLRTSSLFGRYEDLFVITETEPSMTFKTDGGRYVISNRAVFAIVILFCSARMWHLYLSRKASPSHFVRMEACCHKCPRRTKATTCILRIPTARASTRRSIKTIFRILAARASTRRIIKMRAVRRPCRSPRICAALTEYDKLYHLGEFPWRART